MPGLDLAENASHSAVIEDFDTASRLADIAHSQHQVYADVEVDYATPQLEGSRHTVPALRHASKVRAWTLR